MPTWGLPRSLADLLAGFRCCFTAPTFGTFMALLVGFLAQPGQRTVTGMLVGVLVVPALPSPSAGVPAGPGPPVAAQAPGRTKLGLARELVWLAPPATPTARSTWLVTPPTPAGLWRDLPERVTVTTGCAPTPPCTSFP
jgi:hypothetical protein